MLLAVAGLMAGVATAQPAAVPLAEGFDAGALLYEADDVGAVEVVTALYRVGDGGTATLLADAECQPGCMVEAVRVARGEAGLARTDPGAGVGRWLVVLTRSGARVEVDGTLVARGSARLRVPSESHALTFRFADGQVRQRTVTVPVATEFTVAELPARGAPPLVVEGAEAPDPEGAQPTEEGAVAPAVSPPAPGGVAAAATFPAELLAGLLDGAESTPDDPVAGWRLPAVERPRPMRVRERPEMTVAAEVAPPEEPAAEAQAPDETVSDGAAPDVGCPASDLAETAAAADAQIRQGAYAAARACLYALATESDDRVLWLQRMATVDRVLAIEAGLDPLAAQRVQLLRLQMAASAERGDLQMLAQAAAVLLRLIPGDPAAVATLDEVAPRVAADTWPSDGPRLTFAFIPGVDAYVSEAAALLAREGVPDVGYLLSTTEVTNAQFADFLNHLDGTSNQPYVVDRPREIEFARGDVWRPTEGAADRPAIDATWYGAREYARWVGGTLPSESEWVWAYRLGSDTAVEAQANLRSAGAGAAVPAPAIAPDRLGLHHMLGNVWEWLRDARGTSAVVAGGSFTTRREAVAAEMTQGTDPKDTHGHIGFRVLRPLTPID
ncbi:hypothetical protein BSZ37_16585 [Rubrivirga marina]|uniref:Sulfatase-modifying factor enzyme-like domain-containing protein n=1 Tax=Rubrivirga marina TaxID=1196024 RepID=A0A271J3L0_9BACT|nr:hypothetical protein BSZ37_16585 [Rubrivirga marina]